jgi:hypothetical protein
MVWYGSGRLTSVCLRVSAEGYLRMSCEAVGACERVLSREASSSCVNRVAVLWLTRGARCANSGSVVYDKAWGTIMFAMHRAIFLFIEYCEYMD